MNRRRIWRLISQRTRDTRFNELDQLLRLSGWQLNHIRGSHHVYRNSAGQHLSIPRHGPVVSVHYVQLVLSLTREDGDD